MKKNQLNQFLIEEKKNYCTPYKIPQENKSIQSIEKGKKIIMIMLKCSRNTHTHTHTYSNFKLNIELKVYKKQNFYEIVIN